MKFYRIFILTIVKIATFTFILTSCCGEDPIVDTTAPTSLNITASNITKDGMTLTVSAKDETAVSTIKLYNSSTFSLLKSFSASTGTYNLTGLAPSTDYKLYITASDIAGNTATSQTFTFRTLEEIKVKSDWVNSIEATYTNPFAIIGNAVSNVLTININNSTSGTKTLKSLVANFGTNGNAVKMLRYQLNGNAWNVITASNGNITFNNLTLNAGVNTLTCYFALKANVGVANGSALSFTFTSLDDNEGGQVPTNGAFQNSLSVGTVNANTQATVFLTDWLGTMSKPAATILAGSSGRRPIYNVQNLKMSGPGNVRWGSIKLKDPYAIFNKITWDNNSFAMTIGTGDKYISQYSWNNNIISMVLPNDNNSIICDGNSYNLFVIKVSYQNTGSTTFYSQDYTPDLMGFALTSKFDLVIYNSDNQMIDVSDAVIRQDGVILSN